MYGTNKAKVDYNLLKDQEHTPGKLVLVTAINPTPAGEGKTTTTVGLADALREAGQERGRGAARAVARPRVRHQGRRSRRRLRPGHPHGGHQPALHRRLPRHRRGQQPAGGACWTTTSSRATSWASTRARSRGSACVDMNDRQLRNIVDGLGGKANGVPREDGFDITVASEIMAVLLPGHLHHRPQSSAWDASWWATPTTTQPVTGGRPARRGRDDGPAQGRAQAEPRADARGHAGVRARRPLRQHRARLQLRHGHAHGAWRWATTA